MDVQVLHNLKTPAAAFGRLGAFPAQLQEHGVTLTWDPPQPGAAAITGKLTGNVTGVVWVRDRDVYLRGELGFLARTLVGEAKVRDVATTALRQALA